MTQRVVDGLSWAQCALVVAILPPPQPSHSMGAQHRENPETMPSQDCGVWLLSCGSHVGLRHPFLTTCVSYERLMAYGGFWWHSRC